MTADGVSMKGLGLTVLRLALAVVFAAHGANVLFGAWAGPGVGPGGLENTAAFYASLGLGPAFPLAVLAGLVQFAGGILLGLGLFGRWVSLLLLAYVLIGAWKVHLQWGLFLNWIGTAQQGHGVEYSIVLAAGLICFAITGSGEWSVDGLRDQSAASRAAGRARLRGKV